ncbi:hypothetical protein MNBD_GAMMA05-1883 [hydrothermal vent metagenome]|uniref:Glycosyltransferase 2-like domain-containing protein n=1 Tax=hydrothermal vent metagenome TaxID=652676 RepID=A0A3B0WPD9_9ZZZZ
MTIESNTELTLPLVSIVVPVYNAEAFLAESLDSITNQTYPNIEILIMDDASTDGSAEIIRSYGDKITHIRNENNLGQFGNVNKGIEKTKGEFVCVYHADDIYKPDIVEKEAHYLIQNRSAGAVFCMDIFIDGRGKVYNQLTLPQAVTGGGPFDYEAILNALLTYKNVFLIGPTSMVRRNVYFDVGLYNEEEFGIAGDLEMWARIAKSYDLGIIEEHLQYYRHDHGNLSQNYYRLRTETEIHFRIMQNHLDSGGLSLARTDSLKANRAHWSEDLLMVTINAYIKNELALCRKRLRQIKMSELLGSQRIQRGRLFILYLLLSIICRIPRIPFIAGLFEKRWHSDKNKG